MGLNGIFTFGVLIIDCAIFSPVVLFLIFPPDVLDMQKRSEDWENAVRLPEWTVALAPVGHWMSLLMQRMRLKSLHRIINLYIFFCFCFCFFIFLCDRLLCLPFFTTCLEHAALSTLVWISNVFRPLLEIICKIASPFHSQMSLFIIFP